MEGKKMSKIQTNTNSSGVSRLRLTPKTGYEPEAVYKIGAAVAANFGPRVVGVSFTRKSE